MSRGVPAGNMAYLEERNWFMKVLLEGQVKGTNKGWWGTEGLATARSHYYSWAWKGKGRKGRYCSSVRATPWRRWNSCWGAVAVKKHSFCQNYGIREGAGNEYPKLSFLCPLILPKSMTARGQGSPDDEFCRDQPLGCFLAPNTTLCASLCNDI